MNIQWYPGHMTKTKRMMQENIALVDIVIELLDARIPYSSRNPDIDKLAANKKRIVILNKSDLADDKKTERWVGYFESQGLYVLLADSIRGKGLKAVAEAAEELMAEKKERLRKRGRIFVPTRAMVAGIPNVGKSTLINKFVGRSTAKTGDKPGVTRGKQWVRIKRDLELLDTPGILWPKFEDKEVGLKLAFTGAVNDNITDLPELAQELISLLRRLYPNELKARYKIDFDENTPTHEILNDIGVSRGFMAKGGIVDTKRTASIFLDEFRAAKLGKMTLESVEDIATEP